jgi:hypothetical protein
LVYSELEYSYFIAPNKLVTVFGVRCIKFFGFINNTNI